MSKRQIIYNERSDDMGLLSVLMAWSMMLVYLAVIIYLIWLLSRLVCAVETIAKKIEGSSKI